jgi:hypothetical protein
MFTSLQLPVWRKTAQVHSVTFVPFDRSTPPSVLVVDDTDVQAFISNGLGRSVTVALASKQHGTDYRIGNLSSSVVVENFAFEIPDTSKLYVICAIEVVLAIGARRRSIEPTSPLLVEIPDLEIDDETLWSKCAERLGVFWTPSKLPIPQRAISLDFQLRKSGVSSTENRRFDVIKPPSLERHATISFLVSASVRLTMSASHLREERGFNWGTFMTVTGEEVRHSGPAPSVSLRDCFELMAEPEILTEDNKWKCVACDKYVQAEKQTVLWQGPEILIVHLTRFLHVGPIRRKCDTPVEYPEILNLSEFLPVGHTSGASYKLYGVIVHLGTMSGGHYVAYCYHEGKQAWYNFNDSSVQPIASPNTGNAYILFYSKVVEPDAT